MGLHILGTGGFLAAQLAFLFGGTGLMMVYFIFLGELLPPIITSETSSDFERNVTILVVGVCVWPLCCLRSLNKLSFVSSLSVMSVSYLAIYVAINSISEIIKNGISHSAKWYEPGKGVFTTFAMLNSAFSCHIATLPIYRELSNRSFERMQKVYFGGISTAFIIYEIIALPPYFQFGHDIKENILENYEDDYGKTAALKIANIAISITLFCSLPIILWPFRSCLISLHSFCNDENVHADPPQFVWLIATTFCLAFVMALAILFPSVKIAFSIVGCVGGALIVYILPALFYIKSHEQPYFSAHIGPTTLAVLGMIACSISLGVTIEDLFE